MNLGTQVDFWRNSRLGAHVLGVRLRDQVSDYRSRKSEWLGRWPLPRRNGSSCRFELIEAGGKSHDRGGDSGDPARHPYRGAELWHPSPHRNPAPMCWPRVRIRAKVMVTAQGDTLVGPAAGVHPHPPSGCGVRREPTRIGRGLVHRDQDITLTSGQIQQVPGGEVRTGVRGYLRPGWASTWLSPLRGEHRQPPVPGASSSVFAPGAGRPNRRPVERQPGRVIPDLRPGGQPTPLSQVADG